MRELMLVGVFALLGSCRPAEAHDCTCPPDEEATRPPAHDQLKLTKVTWSALPGWASDKHGEAVPAFIVSCTRIAELKDDDPVGHDGHGGKAKQWRRACEKASKLAKGDDKAARAFFESEFQPWQAAGKSGPVGKLTGYFVQEINASRKKGGKYQIPILTRPADLVMIDLSQFIKDAHGRRIWGRHDDKGNIVPYPTRAEIRKGALAKQKLEIMYADDPVDVLFAQIEGSAKAIMDDGTTVWLEFDGKNGRQYRGVGKLIRDLGEPPGSGTMPGIRAWFAAHPDRFDEIADQDEAFVFFKEGTRAGAIGTQQVVLTARRSLAVDRAYVALSTPIWVSTRAPAAGKTGTAPWQRLLIAQDTGGGIKGAVRGDVYWGDDADAADVAGRMGGPGTWWILLPR